MNRKIDDVYRAVDGKIDQRFVWTAGLMVSTWLTTILAIFFCH